MWARVGEGFLKEVCTEPGSEGFHGEKTQVVRRCPTKSTCSGGKAPATEVPESAQSGQGGLRWQGQGFILPPGKGLGDGSLFATLL